MLTNLATRQELKVLSDTTICNDVNATVLSSAPHLLPKAFSAVPEVRNWPGPIYPAELLLLLGVALTPVLLSDLFSLSARWAIYRYFWAFDDPDRRKPLRLSAEADRLVYHHKTLASEQLGIACALLTGLWVVHQKHPGCWLGFADVDELLGESKPSIGGLSFRPVASARRMRPDYFLTAQQPGSQRVHVYALESKGTHSASHWKQQLKKAGSQVRGVTVNGADPPSFLSSTFLSRTGIKVRLLDPPGGKVWSGTARFDGESRAESFRKDDETGQVQILDPEGFRADLLSASDSRRLAFAGQYETALANLPLEVRDKIDLQARPNGRLEHTSNELGEFEVQTLRLPFGDRTIRIESGLAREELETLMAPLSERSERRAADASDDPATDGERGTIVRAVPNRDGFRARRPDGTYLEATAE